MRKLRHSEVRGLSTVIGSGKDRIRMEASWLQDTCSPPPCLSVMINTENCLCSPRTRPEYSLAAGVLHLSQRDPAGHSHSLSLGDCRACVSESDVRISTNGKMIIVTEFLNLLAVLLVPCLLYLPPKARAGYIYFTMEWSETKGAKGGSANKTQTFQVSSFSTWGRRKQVRIFLSKYLLPFPHN